MNNTIKAMFIAAGVMVAGAAQAEITQGEMAGYCAQVADQISVRVGNGKIRDASVQAASQQQSQRIFGKWTGNSDFTKFYNATRQHLTTVSNAELLNTGAACAKKGF